MQIINLLDIQQLAKEKLPKPIYDYYSSGACDEITLHENIKAFQRLQLIPKVLTGTTQSDTSTRILDLDLKFPAMIAPMAFQKMAHPQGELATAKAAKQAGIAYIASTMATYSLEEIAQQSACPAWFQLYLFKDRQASLDLLKRAENSGYTALVLTIDAPIMGKRERDIVNKFSLPYDCNPENFPNKNLIQRDSNIEDSAIRLHVAASNDASLHWKDISWLRSQINLPIILKGIMRDTDAQAALDHGVDGIIVSNHGGRQLDTVPASIELLPKITKKIQGKIPVLLDGGVRRGTDILKALALGAQAVLLGRPVLWGLTLNGEAGVYSVLKTLEQEFIDAMMFCGYESISAIEQDPDVIARL